MKIPRYIYITERKRETMDAFKRIFKIEQPKKILIVTSTSTAKKVKWITDFLLTDEIPAEKLLTEKNDKDVLKKTKEKIKNGSFDLCIGIGGGKILDIAKYASFSEKIQFLSFPTLLSHDGIASPVAVIRDGKHWSESRRANSPFAVIIDIKVVSDGTTESILSGTGDLVANLFASIDAEIFKEKDLKAYNKLSISIARAASLLVFPHFSKISVKKISEEDLKKLAKGLILSGIAMSIAGNSRPASGAEHKISHAIDYIFSPSVSHGYTVSIGNVISAFLHNEYKSEIVEFNYSLGLPVLCDDVGIKKEEFIDVILYAGKIRPDRYTILEEKKLTEKEVIKLLNEIEEVRGRIRGRKKK
ncbi:iron-containing alcohol dehydrogenase [candidate division WOR-3 bacterium]|nr:iron-containing alcohol dehydrogenase [candidate division WOR-3 bacterium]